MVTFFLAVQLTILPIYGLIWLGIRNERKWNQLLMREAIRDVRLVRLSQGNRI